MTPLRPELLDIAMPRLSDSMEEAIVLQWLKSPGDAVAKGEPLVEVETDKSTIVYDAESDGVLEEIVVEPGAAAALGAVIARLRVATGHAPPTTHSVAPAGAPQPPVPAASLRPVKDGRSRATPVARRLAAQLGVGLVDLDGSGPGGRIVASDVRAATPAAAPPFADDVRGTATEREHTVTQRRIAQRMTESRASIPDFTLEAEIDMEAASALRNQLRAAEREPVPSYNDLVIRAAALALREFPALNSSPSAGGATVHGRINVGFAVDAGDALLVPTISDADSRSVFEIAAETARLSGLARDRALAPADLAGGTFTVSNLGMFGVRRFQAVINPPQAAILAVGEVAPRAVVDDTGVVIARMTMEVALSCDHRVVYGAEAARFLQAFRRLLEQPIVLFLD